LKLALVSSPIILIRILEKIEKKIETL